MAVTRGIAQCQPTDFNAIMAAVNANNNEKGFTVTTAPAVCRTALFLVIEEIIEAGRYTREKEFDPHNIIVVDGKPEGFGVELAAAQKRIQYLETRLARAKVRY